MNKSLTVDHRLSEQQAKESQQQYINSAFQVSPWGFSATRHELRVLVRPLSAVHNDFCLKPSVNRTQHRDYPIFLEKYVGSYSISVPIER